MGGTHLSGAPSEFSAYLRYLFGPDCRSEVLGPHGEPSGVGPLTEPGALAGSDRAPGPSSLPVAFAQAASEAGEPGLAAWFGRAPPLRGSGSALAGDAEPAGQWPPSSWQWGRAARSGGTRKKMIQSPSHRQADQSYSQKREWYVRKLGHKW